MQIIYNTTFIVNETIEKEWIDFMRKNYLAILQQHHLCEDLIFTKVSIDQPEGKTYSLQIVFGNETQQQEFLENWLAGIEEKLLCRYADRYLCFSSLLTEI